MTNIFTSLKVLSRKKNYFLELLLFCFFFTSLQKEQVCWTKKINIYDFTQKNKIANIPTVTSNSAKGRINLS